MLVLEAGSCSYGHGLSPYSGDKEHNYVDIRSVARKTDD